MSNNIYGQIPYMGAPFMQQRGYQQQEYRPMVAPLGFGYMVVASRAEVDAAQTPVDGSVAVFKDIVNDRFYTKAFDQKTGTAPVVTYVREIEKTPPAPQYVTMEDFNALKEEIDKLKKPTKKEKQNDTD